MENRTQQRYMLSIYDTQFNTIQGELFDPENENRVKFRSELELLLLLNELTVHKKRN